MDTGVIWNTGKNGGELALTLMKEGGGTRLSSTRFLHYGTVTATSEQSSAYHTSPN